MKFLLKNKNTKLKLTTLSLLVVVCSFSFLAPVGQAVAAASYPNCINDTSQPCCGGGAGNTQISTSIDFGCQAKGNPILDMLFAIIRLLSDGVGIVVIASVIVGGIQYTTSAGDPNASAKAMTRIRSSLTALLIFIFAYAILNYVIPGGFLQ
ncbi:MAG TPA: hypothetical protein VMR95_03770 [Candidatus Binatia bacterium]|nr:hypothetical protein [Candidatus Binatia bacterium]